MMAEGPFSSWRCDPFMPFGMIYANFICK